MKINNLRDVFHDELRDIYHAEGQLLKALPRMAKAAKCDDLRAGLTSHLKETEKQRHRLEKIFRMIGADATAKKCDAMIGLIKEGKQALTAKMPDGHLRDAMLICSAKKVEHYEMSAYCTLKTWAEELGLKEVAQILDESLKEEKAAEEKLSKMGEREAENLAHPGAPSKNRKLRDMMEEPLNAEAVPVNTERELETVL